MLAALFPGQGSQKIGMGDFLLKSSTIAKQLFEEASDTLGFDMQKLCLEGPSEQLQLTANTQPALTTVSYANFCALKELSDLDVKVAAGHSVGEYPALVAAEVIPFAKALELVRLRGQLMQESVPVGQGGMVAVMGLSSEQVDALCQWACKETGQSPLEPANYNSPGQIVISGRADIIAWVQKNFSPEKIGMEAKAKVRLIPLKVSAPFHCSMMNTAEKEMAAALREVDFKEPLFPIAQNFSGNLEKDPKQIQENLISQISGAVRWVDCMQSIKQVTPLIAEFGPGKVLTGLAKKIDGDFFKPFNFSDESDLQNFESLRLEYKKQVNSDSTEES